MKNICLILMAAFLSGCAAKKPPVTNFVTTAGCVTPVQQQNAACTQVTQELYECNHLLVKVSCVKIGKPAVKNASSKTAENKGTP